MLKKIKYSFGQWCIDNDRQGLLDRWDYEKTGFGPSDITYASDKDVYFKYPKGLHESELRKVHRLTCRNDQKDFRCNECMKEYPVINDITGNVYGDLLVLSPNFEEKRKRNSNDTFWKCQCSCGKIISVYGSCLKDGRQVTCGNRTIHRSGKNSSNWKGGITPKLILDRNCRKYDKWRDAVYKKDWYTCQCCGKSRDINKNAHHLNNFSDYEDIKYDVNNGISLCEECHHIKCIGSFTTSMVLTIILQNNLKSI